jgi:murein DD-endopeptidase MepM/ murein hydrolase activator NlpD
MKIPLAIVAMLFLTSRVTLADECRWLLPIRTTDRQSWREIRLTDIGQFGRPRIARPQVPAHLHTGVDLCRPSQNYTDEPIYAASCGKVISLRDDGPFAQIIIEHTVHGQTMWTVYEHIAGITVSLDETVTPDRPIARYMNRDELQRYGWKFDHVHFEVMQSPPYPRAIDSRTPLRRFATHGLQCYTAQELSRYYADPEVFLKGKWQ